MPSSPSSSLRLEEMFTGEQVNVWGVLLDQVIAMLDAGIAGMATIALTGNYSLTAHNYVADEARNAILKFTGSVASVVTIPSVSKVYVVWNASSAIQTVTTGAGSTAAMQVGEVALVVCDAVNVKRVVATVMGAGPFSMAGALDMGASKITSVLDPTNPQDAATKAYADAVAFDANAGILPGQTGSNGKYLKSNGVTALWQQLTSADLSDFNAAADGRAAAMAIALGRAR